MRAGKSFTLTFSVGYSLRDGNIKAALVAADAVLYKVKENGRNSYACAPP